MEHFMNYTIGEAILAFAGVGAVISIFIEITPIKLNPASRLFKWVGKMINGEILDKLDKLEEKVDNIESIGDERNAIACRIRILRFGDEVRRGLSHSKENFDQILEDVDEYEKYCKTHEDFKNHKTVATTEKIVREYTARMDANDFL